MASVSASDVLTKRLTQVTGDNEKKNDVIFCGRSVQAHESNVIFFGGDIQDYAENMKTHHRFKDWNLESTAQLLIHRFPSSHVWVVKSAAMEEDTFCVYSNFLAWLGMRKPLLGAGQNSWQHLAKLLKSAVERMNNDHESQTTEKCSRDEMCRTFDDGLPLLIVGFSQGCVVLNQLVYDLESAAEVDLTYQVRAMYWLDGGPSCGAKVYITDEKVLRKLVTSGIEVMVRVIPYQINDPNRPWIGREHKRFVAQLTQLGGKISDVVLFGDEERSIESHFKVLTEF